MSSISRGRPRPPSHKHTPGPRQHVNQYSCKFSKNFSVHTVSVQTCGDSTGRLHDHVAPPLGDSVHDRTEKAHQGRDNQVNLLLGNQTIDPTIVYTYYISIILFCNLTSIHVIHFDLECELYVLLTSPFMSACRNFCKGGGGGASPEKIPLKEKKGSPYGEK